MDLRVIGARAKEAASYLNSLVLQRKMKACVRQPRHSSMGKRIF